MSDSKNKDYAYEFLSSKQKEIASKIEELLHAVRKSIEETKIS